MVAPAELIPCVISDAAPGITTVGTNTIANKMMIDRLVETPEFAPGI